MTVPCNCCPVLPEGCYLANPDLQLGLGTNQGGVQTAPGASGGVVPRQFDFANWAGTGISLHVDVFYTGPPMGIMANMISSTAVGGTHRFVLTFGQPVGLRALQLSDLDNNAEQLFNFNPFLSGVTGAGLILSTACIGTGGPPPQSPGQGCIHASGNNRNGFALWPNVLSTTAGWTIALPGAFGFGFPSITIADGLSLPAYSCRMPDGTLRWYDSNGTLVPSGNVVPCPGSQGV